MDSVTLTLPRTRFFFLVEFFFFKLGPGFPLPRMGPREAVSGGWMGPREAVWDLERRFRADTMTIYIATHTIILCRWLSFFLVNFFFWSQESPLPKWDLKRSHRADTLTIYMATNKIVLYIVDLIFYWFFFLFPGQESPPPEWDPERRYRADSVTIYIATNQSKELQKKVKKDQSDEDFLSSLLSGLFCAHRVV